MPNYSMNIDSVKIHNLSLADAWALMDFIATDVSLYTKLIEESTTQEERDRNNELRSLCLSAGEVVAERIEALKGQYYTIKDSQGKGIK